MGFNPDISLKSLKGLKRPGSNGGRKGSSGKRPRGGVVGLDIDSAAIAAAEVAGPGQVCQVAVAPLEPGLMRDGEVADVDGLAGQLREFFAEHKLGKQVRIGVANHRVLVRVLDLPAIENEEDVDAAVRFAAQDKLPMPLDLAVIDYRVVARYTDAEQTPRMRVVVAAAHREMIERFAEALRGAGLRASGIDLDSFALIRALYEPSVAGDAQHGAVAYCHLGGVTNLTVATGAVCVFTRVMPFGTEAIAQQVAEQAELTLPHAREWLEYVGLTNDVDSLEGDRQIVERVRGVLEQGAARLADELSMSLDYYAAQEESQALERLVVAGPGTAISGLVERLSAPVSVPVAVARMPAAVGVPEGDGARVTLAVGLALEEAAA